MVHNRSDLRDNEIVVNSALVIRRPAIFAVLFSAIAFLISACASRDEVTTEQSSAQTGSTVPGERVSNEGAVTPGATGGSANVHW
jgi:type IV pilus biogenesis protein CpaD/CtpE